MKSLRDVINEYKSQGKALAHFNFSDSNQLKAIAMGAKETGLPVVAGLSEGEREYFPIRHARALINAYQKEGVAIYLNADHTYSVDAAKAAIDGGVDSIVVDGAKLSFADNEKLLMQVVAYAHSKKRFLGMGHDILVEGELGYIGTSSTVMDKLPDGAAASEEMMTKPEELKKLVEETKIDLVAPAVGNIHGMVKSGQPKLSISRIKLLAESAGVPLVLHGGSGSADEEFTEAVKAGIAMVHINTELRVLYRDALRQFLATDETTPYKFLTPAVVGMQSYLMQKMRLFSGI